jgi:heterodisulfide reductase subunit A-like polyferredoxin
LNSYIQQYHIFRDMRTYGKYETFYEDALKSGSVFLRYEESEPPQIGSREGKLKVLVKDRLTGGEETDINTDLVVLITGMIPSSNTELVNILKLPIGKDGFYKRSIQAKARGDGNRRFVHCGSGTGSQDGSRKRCQLNGGRLQGSRLAA